MPTLSSDLRNKLERTCVAARDLAEQAARAALESVAVQHPEAYAHMTRAQKDLRNKLRARGRQLGDVQDAKDNLTLHHLAQECGYEHWHRMLFARFLAENNLLIPPDLGTPITLDECKELAKAEVSGQKSEVRGGDVWEYAGRCAQSMLPEIFRADLPAPRPKLGEFCVYVHKCKDDSFYIGQTDDFARRLTEHEQGKVSWTAPRLPVESIHWEVFATREEAVKREQDLKTGFGREWLKREYAKGKLAAAARQAGDPVLQVPLAREDQLKLESLLDDLSAEVFTASDSLGWCYQFWQTQRKKDVNESEVKIGADELPSVTQLFTEDYMVDFLLDNTLGAWWWGKQLPVISKQLSVAKTEEECRRLVALPGCPWKYLRFVKDVKTGWRPAAGMFDGWPKTAKELKCLDPCMGSGHFVVGMFERLVAMRMAEDRLTEKDAVAAVIRDNLFGLEIDPRCTQIAAFNLALAAWRRVGHCPLPAMNLACSGLAPNTRESDWLAIAGDNQKLQRGMERLYRLFQKAAVLGSLINPRAGEDDLLVASFHELQPLLEKALAQKSKDETEHEMAVTARGLAKAAEILADQFTLVATNVPYLGRGKQDDVLKDYCERVHPESKAELATCFVERCLDFCASGGGTVLVTPQTWLFLGVFKKLRQTSLRNASWNLVCRLGPAAFQNMNWWAATTLLVGISRTPPPIDSCYASVDASTTRQPGEKGGLLLNNSVAIVPQMTQLENPDATITDSAIDQTKILRAFATCNQGVGTADGNRYIVKFWELSELTELWDFYQMSPESNVLISGCHSLLRWEKGSGTLAHSEHARVCGQPAWGKRGTAISVTGSLYRSLYLGVMFDCTLAAITARKNEQQLPVTVCTLDETFRDAVRGVDQALSVTESSFLKVPFDLAQWQKVVTKKYPNGLPKPFSSDPTQWLFSGHPKESDNPLHVAVARLLGYQWPRQTGSSFPDCPALKSDGLEKLADADGIVCIPSVRGEDSAADRLRKLLAAAYLPAEGSAQAGGKEWKPSSERELIAATGSTADDFDEWLRNDFFEQHCELFHQRPFLWHIWDGRKRDGFHVIVNYHMLAERSEAKGHKSEEHKGRILLEKLTHAYLNEWITRQKHGVDPRHPEDGAEERLAAALELKTQLEAIIEGAPPHDLFVRWKPLSKQAIGWEPDINDGVRMNIRPFLAEDLSGGKKGAGVLRVRPKIKWDKDRGKEPQREKKEFPWFWDGKEFTGDRVNDVHLKIEEKRNARGSHGC